MKRILSFDGGGIRGIFSLQIAARIEQHFRDEFGQPDLVLAEVIDLFAGTSTGAIVAACLAWGASVSEVESLYVDHSRNMFSRNAWWRLANAKYRSDPIAEVFRGYFVEEDGTPALLGSAKLKTKLLIVMRNATTGSPWPVTNNPLAKFNASSLDDCNLRIPLWQLLRASTAAPTYFPAEEINLGRQEFLFVDGGVTPFNNPALLAVLIATLPCYRLQWATGRDQLHVTAVGTGSHRLHLPFKKSDEIYFWDNLKFIVPALIDSAADNQDLMCRVLGDCVHGADIDSEVEALKEPSLLSADQQKFTYVRYNAALDSPTLGEPLTLEEMRMDNLEAIGALRRAGRTYANESVHRDHLWPRGYRSEASAR